MTEEQREAKRLRDRKYRAAKKARIAAEQAKKAKNKPIAKKAPRTASKASGTKDEPSPKKVAKCAQKAEKAPSCACKNGKCVDKTIECTLAISLDGPGMNYVTDAQRNQIRLLLEATKAIVEDILSGED